MDWAGKRVLVVGFGRSGAAAARLLALRGAQVTVTDRMPADATAGMRRELPEALAAELRWELGGHRRETFLAQDLIVLSPGVPPLDEVRAAVARGVVVTGELELASQLVAAPIVAVTGTNGKSTTTSLAGAILTATGRPTFVGGNLGEPLADAVGTPAAEAGGCCVAEVSSFQLETVETFRPRVAAWLNLTPDHLDRYDSLEAYAAAKARIFAAQHPEDAMVLNAGDPVVARWAARGRAAAYWFSSDSEVERGAFVRGEQLVVRLGVGAAEELYPANALSLVGRHNIENALAAILCGRLAGASPEQVLDALREFRPLAHRMEAVANIDGVVYYDDSKGTNVGAVVAALRGFPRPFVLIAGGRDKGGSYEPLRDVVTGRARGVVVIGESALSIAAALEGACPIQHAASLPAAVDKARALAVSGDAVVLSPACSSFDMFRSYEHRAEVFRRAVEALK
jgi:UDP-N-acetylmuramoylalanine--D-glutamate ligase